MKKSSILTPGPASFDTRTRTLPRNKALDVARTLVVVVPLTLLIWVYAERAQATSDTVQSLVAFATSEPSLSATPAEAIDTPVSLSLSGSRGQIDQFKAKLDRQSEDRHLRLTLSPADATAGEHSVDLTRLLNDSPLLADTGVTVTKTIPQLMRVNVDPVVTVEAKVVLPPNLPVTLQNYVFTPPTVTVSGPAPAINAQFTTEAPTIAVDPAAVMGVVSSGERSIDAPLSALRDARLRPSRTSVRMTFEITSRETTYTIPSVTIQTQRPLSLEGKLRVELSSRSQPVVPNVQIRGPVNVVNRYIEGTTNPTPERLIAVLKILPEDVDKSDLSKDVEFTNLKPGVTVVGDYRVGVDVHSVGDPGR